jgi:hypothetical protein
MRRVPRYPLSSGNHGLSFRSSSRSVQTSTLIPPSRTFARKRGNGEDTRTSRLKPELPPQPIDGDSRISQILLPPCVRRIVGSEPLRNGKLGLEFAECLGQPALCLVDAPDAVVRHSQVPLPGAWFPS